MKDKIMKMKIITVAVFALFSGVALASGSDGYTMGDVSSSSRQRQTQEQSIESTNRNNNTVTTTTTGGASTSTGNVTTVNNNEAAIPTDTRTTISYGNTQVIRNTPSMGVAGVFPSAACHGTSSATLALPGLGLGGGSSWVDADCGIRETARMFDGMGLRMDAVAVMCTSKYAKAAPSCKNQARVSGTPSPITQVLAARDAATRSIIAEHNTATSSFVRDAGWVHSQ